MAFRRPIPLSFASLAPALLASPLAAQSVHVVDDSGGVGVDFTDLQTAATTAGEGDLLLVRTGTYAFLDIDGKSLFVVADAGANVSIGGGVTVSNLAAGQTVSLVGLDVVGAPGMSLVANEGPIQVEECNIDGSGFPIMLPAEGAEVITCAAVTFSECNIRATTFGGLDPGLEVQNANVFLYDCFVLGTGDFDGLPGAAGATLTGCSLFVSGSTFQGGPGGDGVLTPPFGICSDGGDGGPGLIMSSHPSCGPPDVTVIDSTFLGGPGGAAGGPACSPGTTGQGIQQTSGTVTTIPWDSRCMQVTAPVREMTFGTLTFQGLPGELAFLLYSNDPDPMFNALFQGVIVPVTTPLFFIFAGTIPPSGTLQTSFNITLGPAEEFRAVYGQSLYFTLPTGFVAGCPGLGVILDASF